MLKEPNLVSTQIIPFDGHQVDRTLRSPGASIFASVYSDGDRARPRDD